MSPSHPGHVLPQDIVPQDGHDDVITALPVTQLEIDELLYGEDRPANERVARLRELADIMRNEQPGEVADTDAASLLGEIEEAIARLSGALDREDDGGLMDAAIDDDPLAHRETLSPDSDELLDIEDEDLESLEETDDLDVLDPEEWDDIPPARE